MAIMSLMSHEYNLLRICWSERMMAEKFNSCRAGKYFGKIKRLAINLFYEPYNVGQYGLLALQRFVSLIIGNTASNFRNTKVYS